MHFHFSPAAYSFLRPMLSEKIILGRPLFSPLGTGACLGGPLLLTGKTWSNLLRISDLVSPFCPFSFFPWIHLRLCSEISKSCLPVFTRLDPNLSMGRKEEGSQLEKLSAQQSCWPKDKDPVVTVSAS